MAMRQSSVHTKDEKSALFFFFLLDTPSNNRVDIVISQRGVGGEICAYYVQRVVVCGVMCSGSSAVLPVAGSSIGSASSGLPSRDRLTCEQD